VTRISAYPVAVENYVKVIYAHTEWQPEAITPLELAKRLGLAASSVTEMVKKLSGLGLVDHQPYGAVTLTTDGTVLALRMVRRHRLIEAWLVDQFGYTWDEVHDEAEVLEHALSDRMLDAIDAQLGFPGSDPHGDPIPTADGTIQIPDATVLIDAHAGTVVRISDRDPSLLRELSAAGIGIGSGIRVDATSPLRLHVDGRAATIDDAALEAVWVATP
jgi:DtxR family Mn-dependent transcriptional regulator